MFAGVREKILLICHPGKAGQELRTSVVEILDVMGWDLVKLTATGIDSHKAAADVVCEINAEPAAILRPDDALCTDSGNQLAVQISVLFLNLDVCELGHSGLLSNSTN